MLSKLLGMLDQEVDVGVGGCKSGSPLLAAFSGTLRKGSELYGGDLVGYDSDAIMVSVGDVQITLHPDQFTYAIWTEDDRVRMLTIEMSGVAITIRTGAEPTM